MVFPVADDNFRRRTTPVVSYSSSGAAHIGGFTAWPALVKFYAVCRAPAAHARRVRH